MPFVVFVITHQLFSIEFISVSSYQEYMTAENKELPFLVWEAIDIWPLCAISLPLVVEPVSNSNRYQVQKVTKEHTCHYMHNTPVQWSFTAK